MHACTHTDKHTPNTHARVHPHTQTYTNLVNFVVVFGAEAAVATRGVFNNLRKSSLVRTAL